MVDWNFAASNLKAIHTVLSKSRESGGVREGDVVVTISLPSRKDEVIQFEEYLSEGHFSNSLFTTPPAFTATGLAAPTIFPGRT
jgi:hypothetical protein